MKAEDVRRWVHYVITFFILFGGLLTDDRKLLQAHLLLCGIVLVHWLTNEGMCILSEMDHGPDDKHGYTLDVLNRFGIRIDKDNNPAIHAVAHAAVLVPALITYLKLRRQHV